MVPACMRIQLASIVWLHLLGVIMSAGGASDVRELAAAENDT
jgi:hypothetical protein